MKKITCFIAILSFMVCVVSCEKNEKIDPTGELVIQERPFSTFRRVYISNGFDLILTQHDSPKLLIETNQNVQEYIITDIIGDEELQIGIKDKVEFSTKPVVKVYLTYSNLRSIFATGGGKIATSGSWKEEYFDCTQTGGGKIEGDFQVKEIFNLSLSGGSVATLSGAAKKLNLLSSGGSVSNFYELRTDSTTISISGGSTAQLHAVSLLKVKSATGGSRIRYKGNPTLDLSEDISGDSVVEKVE